jgi:hypothetical protein
MDPELKSGVTQAMDWLTAGVYDHAEYQVVIANLKQEAASRSRVRLAELAAKEAKAQKEAALHREAAAHPNIITSSQDVLICSEGHPGEFLTTHM